MARKCWAVVWAAVAVLSIAGCEGDTESDTKAAPRVTLSGAVAHPDYGAGPLVVAVYRTFDGAWESSTFAGGTSVSYSVTVPRQSGWVGVFPFNDLNSSADIEFPEAWGYIVAFVQDTDLSSLDVTISPAGSGGGEGTSAIPVSLTVASPYAGFVNEGGGSFYAFTAAASATHTVGLTNTGADLAWHLYDGGFFTGTLLTDCDNALSGQDEICTTPALSSGTTYYLLVTVGVDIPSGSYTLLVTTP